ncbi:hypothetical protein TI04_03025 [Achromatium sp. WMS2]|nr:hypothetical protein TI04_03025 [Achromatium sp. WMS2]
MAKNNSRSAVAAYEELTAGINIVKKQVVLIPLLNATRIEYDTEHRFVSKKGWIACSAYGRIYVHPTRRANPEFWAKVLSIGLICLGFAMIRRREPQILWELACLLTAEQFCNPLKIGKTPEILLHIPHIVPNGGEEKLFQDFVTEGVDTRLVTWAESWPGIGKNFFIDEYKSDLAIAEWKSRFADGIASGVGVAIRIASGEDIAPDEIFQVNYRGDTLAKKAKRWFMNNYPLLGALAASFDIEQNPMQCQRYNIHIAAIDVGAQRIWINSAAGLNEEQTLFVLAHELLHAGLNHSSRCQGRDPFLWNAACDFIVNSWLLEMNIGSPPNIGMLYDPEFINLSAEEIYDFLARNIRYARKLATLSGRQGQPDIIRENTIGNTGFTDAEAYCRRALARGMNVAIQGNRGTLPVGLIEEIKTLSQPPIPWDVRLAQWFDEHFPPPERPRSYAKPSRRQSATPDIPRPAPKIPLEETRKARVFGVVLDTSGSMEPQLLGKALGAIASYSLARDVFAVRLISCDAIAFDHGWVIPENLLERYSVRGRGGTILQPGVDQLNLLVKRGEFPDKGPLLIITDGLCENDINIPFTHAFILPEGRYLPFRSRGEVFNIK